MTDNNGFDLIVIGDRINPGFKPTRVLVEAHDIAGIQALAARQVENGARYLDVTIGPRAVGDHGYLAETIRAIQAAVTVPLCFDYTDVKLQDVCLKTYDRARAGGAPPLINSITEQRWEIMDLFRTLGPFQVIVMASERVEDGVAKANKTPEEFAATARRAALRLQKDYGLAMDDIFIDISVSAAVADTTGLHRATLVGGAHDPQRSRPARHPHHGRAHQYRPAVAAESGGRLRSQAFARMRFSDDGGAAWL